MKGKIKGAIDYLKNTDIDIRIRLLFLIEYAILCACLVGTVVMLLFTISIYMVIPNLILLVLSIAALILSHRRQRYDLAMNLLIVGCAYISLPLMFFTAGGYESGMVIWFMFGVVFCCVISIGKNRIIMPIIMVVISASCMLIGYYHPEWILSLENEAAVFFDTLQSFVIVSFIVIATLYGYLSTYDRQGRMLAGQKDQMKKMAYMDSLTGIPNRHSYYDDIAQFKEAVESKNLVVLAMDVNGLKGVNDSEGHAAGDALIKCAADIIVAAYGKLGKVYRIGGDEFAAILFCENKVTERLADILKDAILVSKDALADDMSIALGYAAWNIEKGKSFFELEKLADSRMYEDKREYYARAGIDRRKC